MTADCDLAMEQVMSPIVQCGISIRSITKKSLNEVISFAKPPPGVKEVFQAIFIILGKPKPDWKTIQKEFAISSGMQILYRLTNFIKEEKETLTAAKMKKLAVYTKKEDFSAEAMA